MTALILAGRVVNLAMLPHPVWMALCGIVLAAGGRMHRAADAPQALCR